jgi:hypothetical protein
MSAEARCEFSARVRAHFDGSLAPAEDHALFEHLPGCARCASVYERHLLLESLDPAALGPARRLRRGVLPPATERFGAVRTRRAMAAVGVLALAAAALLVFKPVGVSNDDAFHARGEVDTKPAARIVIYRVSRNAPPRIVEHAIERGDELAFAYENPSAKAFLLVFATDDKRRTYWYHPAWTRSTETPQAVAIAPSNTLVELRDAVAHPFEGSRLRIYALFADTPLSVKDVEARVEALPPLAPVLGLPGTIETSRVLDVR